MTYKINIKSNTTRKSDISFSDFLLSITRLRTNPCVFLSVIILLNSCLAFKPEIPPNRSVEKNADFYESNKKQTAITQEVLSYPNANNDDEKRFNQDRFSLHKKSQIADQSPKNNNAVKSEKIIYQTITIRQKDTLRQLIHEINNGKVAFYCPRVMYYKETTDAYGFISDVLSDEDIRKMLMERIKEETGEHSHRSHLDDNNFLIRTVQFYRMIELRLENVVKGAFEIVPVHSEARQEVADNMENWHWKITPMSDVSDQQLILRIIVYDENGQVTQHFNKTYHLNIKIRPYRFFHNAMVMMVENPAWTIGSIVIPIITFFLGRISLTKKSKRKKAA